MLNPDPEKFATLPEAFNTLGHSRFGKQWTGAELAAKNLPPPNDTFHALKAAEIVRDRAHQERDLERRTKADRARKAAAGVRGGVRLSRRPRSGQPTPDTLERERLVEVARYAHLEPEIALVANNQNAYRKEYRARSRRDETESELRKLLHGKDIPATLLNNHDGKLVDIPPAYWLSEKFHVDFTSGQADWANLDEDQPYKGSILIDRRKFDRVVTGPQKTTASAEFKCREWAGGATFTLELPAETVVRKRAKEAQAA